MADDESLEKDWDDLQHRWRPSKPIEEIGDVEIVEGVLWMGCLYDGREINFPRVPVDAMVDTYAPTIVFKNDVDINAVGIWFTKTGRAPIYIKRCATTSVRPDDPKGSNTIKIEVTIKDGAAPGWEGKGGTWDHILRAVGVRPLISF